MNIFIITMKKIKLNNRHIYKLTAFLLLFFVCIISFCFDNTKSVKKTSLSEKTKNETALKVTVANKARKLPLYGFNGNNSKGPAWSDKTFRDSIESLHFKAIRYPGGNVSNWWQWQTGGFVDDPSVPEKLKVKFTPFTLQDLKLLVDETHCDVVFTLNMVTKDLSDQIEMLTQAQSLKIPVKWIELGNEFNNSKNPGRQKFLNAYQYAQTCKQWIDALKSHFPDVQVGIVGGNRNYNPDVKNWNSIVLQNAPNADAIVAHIYPSKELILDDSGINFQNLLQEYTNSFVTQGFTTMKNNKNIWVTEYNINWVSENDDNAAPSKAYTWGQALASLLMTSVTTSMFPNTTMILNHNISNTPVFAAIDIKRKGFQKLPNGIGMATWLTACDNMESLDKLIFSDNNNQPLPDYQLLGWKFVNNKTSSLLLVNLTGSPVKVNLSNLTHANAGFETKYADKNSVIRGAGDVQYIKGSLDNVSVNLPAYSITTIKN